MKKICSKCSKEKEISDYTKCKNTSDGVYPSCRECKNENYTLNKKKILRQTKEYYLTNKEHLKVCKKIYYENNKLKNKDKERKYYIDNKEKILKRVKKYRSKNKEKHNTWSRAYIKQQRKTNKKFYIVDKLRRRLSHALRQRKWRKSTHFAEYIGCSREELVSHIESLFTDGMTWENRNLWHVDHIIPLSSAKTEEELYKLSYYTNLQPLWAIDNLRKSDKIIDKEKK